MPSDRYIPKGAASLQITADGPAREFYFLLLPKLTMLAFSSAIEPLRIANQLAQKQLYTWYAITPDGQGATCSNGVTIQSDGAMGQISKEASVFVCSGIDPIRAASKEVLGWIRQKDRQGTQLGGICTGAFALAQAGVIRDRRFTLHWENQPAFVETFPDLVPTENLYDCLLYTSPSPRD